MFGFGNKTLKVDGSALNNARRYGMTWRQARFLDWLRAQLQEKVDVVNEQVGKPGVFEVKWIDELEFYPPRNIGLTWLGYNTRSTDLNGLVVIYDGSRDNSIFFYRVIVDYWIFPWEDYLSEQLKEDKRRNEILSLAGKLIIHVDGLDDEDGADLYGLMTNLVMSDGDRYFSIGKNITPEVYVALNYPSSKNRE